MAASSDVIAQLATYGPDSDRTAAPEEALDSCRALATHRRENFTVLSSLVPVALRDDFAVLYAFCRWSDDLADETGDAERSQELLVWWRAQLVRCEKGESGHPVFVALAPVMARHDLPWSLLHDLLDAFESDQQVTRYETWDDLLGYCRKSANPVGRLVLMMLGEPRTPEVFAASDAICTALQLTNHWQDVRRDLVERDRIYIPRDCNPIEDFAGRLRATIEQGYAPDHEFLDASRKVIKELVDRTWKLYRTGSELFPLISVASRPVCWLLMAGGYSTLHAIERSNYETVLQRPSLSRFARLYLVLTAKLRARTGAFKRVRP